MNIYDNYEQNRKIIKLEEEIRTLKNKIEFLTICLNDRDKSIALAKKENKKLEEKNKYLKKENERISKQRDNLSGVCDRVIEENNHLELENKKLKAELELKNLALKQAQEGSILV